MHRYLTLDECFLKETAKESEDGSHTLISLLVHTNTYIIMYIYTSILYVQMFCKEILFSTYFNTLYDHVPDSITSHCSVLFEVNNLIADVYCY